MNTFERYFKDFRKFEERIVDWKPDYIVPVAKKGCKLLKASNRTITIDPHLIKYRSFFQIDNTALSGKKVAVVDDATQFTSTLQEYRHFFEKKGADVRTFSFVGHESLFEGKRWKHDEKAEIAVFLPEPVYQEYILQQSYFLLEKGNQFDLDHVILETTVTPEAFDHFLRKIRTLGLLLFLEDYFLPEETVRFSLNDPLFFKNLPFVTPSGVNIGPLKKLKFVYKRKNGKLYFSPLVFPTWAYRETTNVNQFFAKIPFSLPFKLPTVLDLKDKSTRLRIYNNIQFVYAVYFAKAFLQEIADPFNFCKTLIIKRDDFDAMYGSENTNKFLPSTRQFLCESSMLDFKNVHAPRQSSETSAVRGKFKNFDDVITHLKKGYENLCRRKRTKVGVHYYLTYDSLFSKYDDKVALSENLDYYCDFGVIVPETIEHDGKLQRACRTGEPKSEYNWLRTQVLVPLVIEQFCKEQKIDKKSVPPMILNKLISNFTYDYPGEHHHELHCFIGEPYTFGTLVKAYHHHRARSKPSLYSTRQISPYYKWDKKNKQFSTVNLPEVMKKIGYLFDERQEIAYSEIITYFRLLSNIYVLFQRVDVLNMLSICREENYFYSHILYNIRAWVEEFGIYLDDPSKTRRLQALHECGTQCNSSAEKIKLAKDVGPTMKTIFDKFGHNFEFVKAVAKLKNNWHKFQLSFTETLSQLENIIHLEFILTNLCLFVDANNDKYSERLKKLDFGNVLARNNITITLPIQTLRSDKDSYNTLIYAIYDKIKILIDSLPSEEPLLATRLRFQEYERARNIATEYVNKEELTEAAMLFMDFTGLRTIPEPKEYVISRFYAIVEKCAKNRSGVKLYGGRGGDDAFTFIFKDITPALQCAKDIKRDFGQNLFLASQGDIKFGVSYSLLSPESKETDVVQCWGLSKDCCEFKGTKFRNKGHLIVSQHTIDNMRLKGNESLLGRFSPVEGATLKDGAQIYSYSEVLPLQDSNDK